jgi:hypothetical protein
MVRSTTREDLTISLDMADTHGALTEDLILAIDVLITQLVSLKESLKWIWSSKDTTNNTDATIDMVIGEDIS